jgi:hypothetical protein
LNAGESTGLNSPPQAAQFLTYLDLDSSII